MLLKFRFCVENTGPCLSQKFRPFVTFSPVFQSLRRLKNFKIQEFLQKNNAFCGNLGLLVHDAVLRPRLLIKGSKIGDLSTVRVYCKS
jgi:hypothetical protein